VGVVAGAVATAVVVWVFLWIVRLLATGAAALNVVQWPSLSQVITGEAFGL
jgi:hypothetical protein